MGEPHPSRMASCIYCFRHAVQNMHRQSWSVVILSRDCSHRQSLQVTRGAMARSPAVGFGAVMVRQESLPTESISLPSVSFKILNPWLAGFYVPPPGPLVLQQPSSPCAPKPPAWVACTPPGWSRFILCLCCCAAADSLADTLQDCNRADPSRGGGGGGGEGGARGEGGGRGRRGGAAVAAARGGGEGPGGEGPSRFLA